MKTIKKENVVFNLYKGHADSYNSVHRVSLESDPSANYFYKEITTALTDNMSDFQKALVSNQRYLAEAFASHLSQAIIDRLHSLIPQYEDHRAELSRECEMLLPFISEKDIPETITYGLVIDGERISGIISKEIVSENPIQTLDFITDKASGMGFITGIRFILADADPAANTFIKHGHELVNGSNLVLMDYGMAFSPLLAQMGSLTLAEADRFNVTLNSEVDDKLSAEQVTFATQFFSVAPENLLTGILAVDDKFQFLLAHHFASDFAIKIQDAKNPMTQQFIIESLLLYIAVSQLNAEFIDVSKAIACKLGITQLSRDINVLFSDITDYCQKRLSEMAMSLKKLISLSDPSAINEARSMFAGSEVMLHAGGQIQETTPMTMLALCDTFPRKLIARVNKRKTIDMLALQLTSIFQENLERFKSGEKSPANAPSKVLKSLSLADRVIIRRL